MTTEGTRERLTRFRDLYLSDPEAARAYAVHAAAEDPLFANLHQLQLTLVEAVVHVWKERGLLLEDSADDLQPG